MIVITRVLLDFLNSRASREIEHGVYNCLTRHAPNYLRIHDRHKSMGRGDLKSMSVEIVGL